MSRAAKTFFTVSLLVGIASIGGVHLIQQQERETMFAGVIRDEARLAAKKAQRAREAEFEEQARKRAYLETVQGVSNPVQPPPKVDEVPTSAEGMDFGCKSCEKFGTGGGGERPARRRGKAADEELAVALLIREFDERLWETCIILQRCTITRGRLEDM